MINIVWIILGIIGGLLALIAILLLCSVNAYIEYNESGFSAKAKYLFVSLYDSDKPKKPKKLKKMKKSKKSKKSKKKRNPKKSKKKSFVEKIKKESGIEQLSDDVQQASKSTNAASFDFEMFKLIYDSAKSPVKRLIQKLRVERLQINCVIGGDNAAKTALTYGFQSAAISAFLAWANEIVTLKTKEVNVSADFAKNKTDLQFKCRVKLRVWAAVVCLIKYVKNNNL